jgi:hypothetical protein
MSVLKLWAWRAIAVPALLILLPLFAFMGEMDNWRYVWRDSMSNK